MKGPISLEDFRRNLFSSDPSLEPWWVDISNPTGQEVDAIAATFALNQLTLEDIKRRTACEKCEFLSLYYVVSLDLSPQLQDIPGGAERARTYTVVFPAGVLTITFCSTLSGQYACKLRRPDMGFTSEWICCALLENTIVEARPLADKLRLKIDIIEDTCHTAEVCDPSSILLQAYSCYRDASLLSRFLAGKAAIVKTLLRHNDNKGHPASTNHREYLEHINHRISDLALGLAESERVLFQAESTLLRHSAIHSARTRTQLAAIAAALMLLSVVLCYMHYNDARQPPAHL